MRWLPCNEAVPIDSAGSFFFLSIMVLGGFVLAKPDIKIWWNWAYYVSPITYAQVCFVQLSNQLPDRLRQLRWVRLL